MLQSLFSKEEYRILFVGLDAAGKTTALYKMKLGEVVTTIPTIGFNVETITHLGAKLTIWDVGGCDKIRPLWRHYFTNTQALIMVVDSSDVERLGNVGDGYETAAGLLHTMLHEDELRDAVLLVYLNKQDLPNAQSPQLMIDRLGLSQLRNRTILVQGCTATTGDGLYEGMTQLVNVLQTKKRGGHSKGYFSTEDQSSGVVLSPPPIAAKNPIPSEEEHLATVLEEWLQRDDEPDDVFLKKLEDFTLETWDHRTHLRVAWIIINRDGRALGTPKIFHLLKEFIAHSPRTQRASSSTRGTTFHETMTFFWIHMVHYAIVATKLPKPEFKMFLLMNPQLVNGGLFMKYYSRKLMLHTPEARSSVMLPDILPLPSRIPSDKTIQNVELLASTAVNIRLPQISSMSDGKVISLFQQHTLPAWGHEVKLRVIYIMLNLYGRNRGGVDKILDALQSFEGIHFHVTEAYFWIQMITFYMLSLQKHLGLPTLWQYGKLSSAPVEPRPETPPPPDAPAITTEGDGSHLPDVPTTSEPSTAANDSSRILRKAVDFSNKQSELDVLLENVLSFQDFEKRVAEDRSLTSLGFASTLIDEFYSVKLLDSESCKTSFTLPDLKPLPSIVK